MLDESQALKKFIKGKKEKKKKGVFWGKISTYLRLGETICIKVLIKVQLMNLWLNQLSLKELLGVQNENELLLKLAPLYKNSGKEIKLSIEIQLQKLGGLTGPPRAVYPASRISSNIPSPPMAYT